MQPYKKWWKSEVIFSITLCEQNCKRLRVPRVKGCREMRVFHFCVPSKSPSCPLGLSEVHNWCLRSIEILIALGSHSAFVRAQQWNVLELVGNVFLGFLSICCTARSVDVQCCTFCIHVVTLHSSFQESQLLPVIFLNLHSLLLNIFYSVFLFLKKNSCIFTSRALHLPKRYLKM